jgi:hypothetical protein
MTSIPAVLAVIGVVLLILDLFAARSPASNPPPMVQRHPRWFLGFRWALVLVSLFCRYPLQGGKYIVLGVPFMVGVFEWRGDHYRDHVRPGPLPLLALMANILFFQFLPKLVFASRQLWLAGVRGSATRPPG